MKKIAIVTPVYNEKENLFMYYETMTNIMASLPEYKYEILLIDNCSTDGSRECIRELCKKDSHVKAIFNAMNFGFNKSVYHGLRNSDGDCTILINCDLQDPPELIPQFVKEWEQGYKCVLGIKRNSRENLSMRLKRRFYYMVVSALSENKQVLNHTGFGLYDKSFIRVLQGLNEPTPYLQELVSTFAFDKKEIEYTQEKRKHGKGVTSVYALYDDAMTGLTMTSKKLMRFSILFSGILGVIAIVLAIQQFVLKLLHPEYYVSGIATLTVALLLLSTMQLFFIGILGEYILSINIKAQRREVVFEAERINFDCGECKND